MCPAPEAMLVLEMCQITASEPAFAVIRRRNLPAIDENAISFRRLVNIGRRMGITRAPT